MIRLSRSLVLTMLVVGATLIGLAGPVSAASATTLWVDGDGDVGPGCGGTDSSAYTTIQAAVAAVTLNNTRIYVCPGDYQGQVVIDEEDGTIIRAVDPWTATLMPASDHPNNFDLITISGVQDTKIVGLDIVIDTSDSCALDVGAAIHAANAPRTMVRANHIRATGADTLGDCGYARGIQIEGSDGSLVAWNRVIDFNTVGIDVYLSDGVRARGNTLLFNHPNEGAVEVAKGIAFDTSSVGYIRGNVIRSASTAGDTTPLLDTGINFYASNGTSAARNRVVRADRGINAEFSEDLTISGNRVRFAATFGIGLLFTSSNGTVENNSVKSGDDQGMTVESDSDGNTIRDNDFRDNGGTDCRDSTTLQTNVWTNNLGAESDPAGLCAAPI